MSENDEAVTEAMARAMSKAEIGTESIWDHFLNEARRQLAAHRAMIKAEKEQGE